MAYFTVLNNVSGFTSRVQQFVCDSIYDTYIYLYNTGYTFEGNRGYQLSFKYKSNVISRFSLGEGGGGTSSNIPELPINIGAPSLITTGLTTIESGEGSYLAFYAGDNDAPLVVGDYFMIDEVNLYKNTTPNYPVCSTRYPSNYTTTTVQMNGLVNPYGASTTVTFEYATGTTYYYYSGFTNTVTATQSPVTGINDVTVSYPFTYTPGIYYFYRVKASNAYGTTTGNNSYSSSNEYYFRAPSSPIIGSYYVSNHNNTDIKLSGYVNPTGISTTVDFEWGTSLSYGNTVTATQSPSSSLDGIYFSAPVTGLNTGTTYHFRVKATNGLGTSYSSDYPFVTWTVGTNFSGGTIFYFFDNSHMNGIIASNQDQDQATWGCSATTIGVTGYTYGFGSGNTINIVNGCSESGIAAKVCNDLSLSGYTDWWLPSLYELYLMIYYKSIIGGFTLGTSYWSSSEYQFSPTRAMYVNVNYSAPTQSEGLKNVIRRVRAIRYYKL